MTTYLELLHSSDVRRLDVVLHLLNTLLKVVHRDLVVLNDKGDLKLVHTVTDGHKLAGTPDKTVHFNSADLLLEGGHVSFIIPRLHVESDNTLSRRTWALSGLASLVLLNALSLNALSFRVNLILIAKEVNVLVITTLGSTEVQELSSLALVTLQAGVLSLERLDMLLPARDVRVLGAVDRRLDGLIDGYIRLGSLMTALVSTVSLKIHMQHQC